MFSSPTWRVYEGFLLQELRRLDRELKDPRRLGRESLYRYDQQAKIVRLPARMLLQKDYDDANV
jgi:hypothetical protein